LRLGALLAGGACFLLAPFSPLALLGLLACAGMLLLWPAGGLALIAAATPLYVRPPNLFGFNVPGVESILWLTALGWLIERLVLGPSLRETVRRLWATRSAIDLGVAALLLAGTLSTLAAEDVLLASYQWRTIILSSAVFYLLWRVTPAQGDENAWRWRMVDALVAGGILVALIGLCQRVFSAGLITAEGVARVRALYGSPNNLGLYLERILPIALAVAAWSRGRRRWVYAAACAPLIAALYLTYSRGAWLLGLPAALVVMGLARGGRWRWAGLAGVLAALLALIPLAGTQRLDTLLDFSAGTGLVRVKLWQSAWNMALDHPVLGVGPDNFLNAYRTRYVLPSAW
jgi:hypothetical protein